MQIISRSVKDTLNIGRHIVKNLQKGDIICLFGKFGAGKTVLTKGIAMGLGIAKDKIISPSFVLIREYDLAKIPLYHFDLYRMEKEKDILGLGYEDYLNTQGIAVIEWADKLKELLPREYLKIRLEIIGKDIRKVTIRGMGKRYAGYNSLGWAK